MGVALKKAYAAQRDAVKTPRDLARSATIVLIVGPVVWAIILLCRLAGLRLEEAIRNLGVFMGIAGLAIMIMTLLSPLLAMYQFALVLFRARRHVVCPFCGRAHSIFQQAASYICTGCGGILRFSTPPSGAAPNANEPGTGPFAAVQCPRCGTEWASDAPEIRCCGCGLPLTVQDGTAAPKAPDSRCPNCGAGAHEGSYFCSSCGEIISEPEELGAYSPRNLYSTSLAPVRADGMDAISLMALPAGGRIVSAYRAAHRGCATVDALGDKAPDWAQQWQAMAAFTNGLIDLNAVVREEPGTASAALGLRLAIQQRYARLLAGCVDGQTGGFCKTAVRTASDYAALANYQRLLKQLTAADAEQCTLLSEAQPWVVPEVTAAQGSVVVENAAEVCQFAAAVAAAPGGNPGPVRVPLELFRQAALVGA